jgi:hypothetical protein
MENVRYRLLKDTPVTVAGTVSMTMAEVPQWEKDKYAYPIDPNCLAFPSPDGKEFDYNSIEFIKRKPEWFELITNNSELSEE